VRARKIELDNFRALCKNLLDYVIWQFNKPASTRNKNKMIEMNRQKKGSENQNQIGHSCRASLFPVGLANGVRLHDLRNDAVGGAWQIAAKFPRSSPQFSH